MQPQAFYDEKVLVRWALQQMEDKAGPWAIRQMQRMDTELDEDGDPPEELRDWTRFCESFLTQFDDPGLVEKARVKWKDGINQRGKAVDYFEEIETLLIRLKYPRDQDMTLDQIIAGLKPHIRTHFIRSSWDTLNEMKSQVIPYDSAYWEINKATGAKTGGSKDSKATSSTQERGKSTTPQVKTEVAKAGATQRRFLPQDEFELCKANRWCFKCKADGKEIVGSVRFHPNHLPQTNTKTTEKKDKNTKIAATKGKETSQDSDENSDSEPDCDQSKN